MSDSLVHGLSHLSTVGHYGRQNTQTLAGVSHLWQDFFARALADNEPLPEDGFSIALQRSEDPSSGEPLGGARVLELIEAQRACAVEERLLQPPEALFLPKAELERALLDPAPEPFSPHDLIAQQRQLDVETAWLRPVVMQQGQPLPAPGPAPQPRTLTLPIAEFETALLPPAPMPYPTTTLLRQQHDLEVDVTWRRPVVIAQGQPLPLPGAAALPRVLHVPTARLVTATYAEAI